MKNPVPPMVDPAQIRLQQDALLVSTLEEFLVADEDFWTFRNWSSKQRELPSDHHIYYQYPAMMVPQMQGHLIDSVISIHQGVKTIYDPFMGSGTILSETMLRGLDFMGNDINPLSILICKMKSDYFNHEEMLKILEEVIQATKVSRTSEIEIDFFGLIKWYRSDVALVLSKLHIAIKAVESMWCRRFLWVCLAETARLCSNSKSTTYKLHSRTKEEIYSRSIDPLSIFKTVSEDNIRKKGFFVSELKKSGFYTSKGYSKDVEIHHCSSTSEDIFKTRKADLLVSSPPYGDNHSTISYGQQAFLPLHWIDLDDIYHNFDKKWLSSINFIDSESLGGKSKRDLALDSLYKVSPSLEAVIDSITKEKGENLNTKIAKVVTFFSDMYNTLLAISNNLNNGAYMVWTVGNRRVNQNKVPMDEIFKEFLDSYGMVFVHDISRKIPKKRFFREINNTKTMTEEHTLILRKETSNGN